MNASNELAIFSGPRLGIDLGGTSVTAVVVNGKGKVCGVSECLTGDHSSIHKVLSRIEMLAQQAMERADISSEQLEAAGIGLPGEVDLKRGELRSSPILTHWRKVPVARLLEDRLGIAFAVDNDANAALIGERYFGAARNVHSALMITIGTGIGGALVLDGQIWRGKEGSAGEVGHLCVDADGPRCWCGQQGCLGKVASTTALIDYFQRRSTCPLPSKIDGRYVAERFWEGDLAAQVSIEIVSGFIAHGIEMAACVVAPDRVVLHGGILNTLAGPLLEGVRKGLSGRDYPAVLSSIEVVEAELGLYAGAIGAAVISDLNRN